MSTRLAAAALACALATPLLAPQPARAQIAPLAYVQLLAPPALREVQQRLHDQGVYTGTVDGTWGQDSLTALQQFQQSHGLQVTGQMNPGTAQALGLDPVRLLQLAQAPVQQTPPPMRLGPDAIRNIQQRLAQMGYYHGGLDGEWGPGTQAAVAALQRNGGIQPTGQLNPATVTAMGLDPNNPGAPIR